MSKANCHTGNPLVFETSDGVRFYAGGNTRNGGWMQMKPRPELAIGPQGVIRVARTFDVIPDGFTCVNDIQAIDVPHIIELEWPDFSIPSNVGREFWLSLVDDIKTKGIKSVSCQCMGGHGRTGVQLAIFAHFMIEKKNQTWKDAGELIQWVRDSYCTHAVEAKSQQEYISTVCQIPQGADKVEVLSSSGNFSWDALPTTKFDSDALDMELEGSKSSKKKQVGKNHTSKYKAYGYGEKKDKISSKIPKTHVRGYALYCCNKCESYEFRTNDKKEGRAPCDACYAEMNDVSLMLGEMTLDDANQEEACIEKCYTCADKFHPLEMHGEHCKQCTIDMYISDVKTKKGDIWRKRQFKCDVTKRWWPLIFSEISDNELGGYKIQSVKAGLDEKKFKGGAIDDWC